ncbi:cyclin-dependent kinase inhibitor 1B isoform X2 [Lacerta agilis]|uniref:cyclin-dependent kinase inhibitor 1B isoform X2 n=1 Tax=Lacerta agilis TaxID=80427 RepID=UPI0014196B77|nr:cyclin-dependent kinase inhibitor 1B isoform X2 [Lacerta agilis]
MSNVRLSNGSPTLERMEARQADYPKPSACRSLFGPVDHDKLARELEKHNRELEEAGRSKWNFDFQRYQPLEGRYEWQAVAKDALPDFYSRPPRLSRSRAKAGSQRHPPPPPPPPPPRLGGLDVNGNCPATVLRRSQGISEEEEDAAARGPEQETGAAGAATDLVGHSSGPRKRPASDELRTFISLFFEGIKFMKQGRCRVYI